jgi:hypothetical protein
MTEYSKNDLKEAFALFDDWTLFENMGKSTVHCDENDVVFIKDESGANRIMMSLETYQEILEYGKKNSTEKRTCREKEMC